MIGILDYGLGNLESIRNILRKVGSESVLISDPSDLESLSKLVLPGVGHFDYAMRNIRSRQLELPLRKFAMVDKKPVLGICLGAQIMGNSSEEGSEAGLGWFNMKCKRFPGRNGFPVPNMGWNTIHINRSANLFANLTARSRFYFVHSYYMSCEDLSDSLAYSSYGIQFTCAVARDNIYGCQFHPEKSHKYGMAVMKNFASLC